MNNNNTVITVDGRSDLNLSKSVQFNEGPYIVLVLMFSNFPAYNYKRLLYLLLPSFSVNFRGFMQG